MSLLFTVSPNGMLANSVRLQAHAQTFRGRNRSFATMKCTTTLMMYVAVAAGFVMLTTQVRGQQDNGMPQLQHRPSFPSGLITRSVDDVTRNPEAVTALDLSRQRLTELPREVLQCVNLQTLVVAFNELRDLPSELSNLRQLRSITLTNNQLEQIPKVLLSMPWLEVLVLRGNTIRFIPALAPLKSLTTLDVRNNPVDSLASDALAGLSGLRVLDLSGTKVRTLPASIGDCVLLSDLLVSNARLTSLPKQIGQLQALQRLDVSNNALSSIPESVLECGNLLALNISNNALTTLPARLRRLRTLEMLKASGNSLSSLPDTLYGMQLKRLEIDSNRLTTLPEAIGDLVMLDVLSARFNKLSSVPTSIGRCQNLSILELGGNAIRSLPVAELAQIPGLSRISIADKASPYSLIPDVLPTAPEQPTLGTSPAQKSSPSKKPATTTPSKKKKP